MYTDLPALVADLERMGELVRISAPVSPVLEIAEIADRVSKSPAPSLPSAAARRNDPRFHHLGGPAILFEQVEGSDFPVLINAFGSYARMELALGCQRFTEPGSPDGFDAIAARIADLVKPEPPRSIAEAVAAAKKFAPLARVAPKRLARPGPCQQVVHTERNLDLTRLPIIKCWPKDGDPEAVGYPPDTNAALNLGHPDIPPEQWNAEYRGRFITLAGVHTVHADDRDESKPKSHNIGMYRMQLLGRDRLAMHWHMHHDGAAHWRSWKKLGKPMPVALALGGPSVLPYAATCPLPPGISELLMAGFLQGSSTRLCRGQTVPLWVPADAEIIIEGFVRTDAGFPGWDPRDENAEPLGPGAVFEGPFGDHTGFYSMPDRYPIMEVTAVTHRENAIYSTTVVGLPPQEDYYLGKATERIMRPLLQTIAPDIVDYDLPMFGAFHNCAFIQIDKAFPLHAHRVASAIWGAGQMSWTKMIFVVDDSVDVHDAAAVLRLAAERCDPARDLIGQMGPLDILDHAAPWLGAGGKLALDCTTKGPAENIINQPRNPNPDRSFTPEVLSQVETVLRAIPDVLWAACPPDAAGWAFAKTSLRGPEAVGGLIDRLAEALAGIADPPAFLVILAETVCPQDFDAAMFHLCANTDFARDLRIFAHSSGPSIAIMDATPKVEGAAYALPARAWPPIIEMDEATKARVTARWSTYGLPTQ
jgi:4-hydroxy-3-polyprenylbenzoate decarboxylase